jgi:hypothetical protein
LKRSDDKNHPVNKFKAGSKGRQQVKARNLSNGRMETMTNVTPLDPALNEIKFKPPQQDIQQLGTALAIELNMVSEPKQEMTRLVDDSQVCNASLNLFSLSSIVIVGAILKRSLNWTVIGCKDLNLLACLSNY